MSYKLGVIGCGHVGTEYIYSVINQALDINEIILIDKEEERTKGMAEDMCHSLSFSRSYIDKIYLGEYSDLKDADIVCITAGMPQSGTKKSRMEDLKGANSIIEEIMKNLNESGFEGIILVASNPLDVMTQKIADLYNKQYSRVIGSGTLLETARLRYEIANKLDFPVKSISGYVYGEHGASQFVLWDSIKVNDTYSIQDYLTEKEMLEIADKVKLAGTTVCLAQGFTCYGVANALSRITRAVTIDNETDLVCSTYDEEKEIYISSLSKLNRRGVISNKLYELTDKEKELYDMSANIIKEGYETIK